MIPINNNLCPLAWHRQKGLQNHRKSYAYGDIYPLYAPLSKLLPFQFLRPHRNDEITDAALFDCDGKLVADITTEMKEAGLKVIPFDEYDVIFYPGTFPISSITTQGRYYLTITDGVDVWYSDIITLVPNIQRLLKVEWWDVEDLEMDAGRIVYKPNYRNVIYLNTEIGKPDYQFEEEGSSRDGYFFAEKQISKKVYRFVFLASEFLCDAMRFIRMSDYVVVTDQYGRQYDCDTFNFDPKWEVQGNLASAECEFSTNTAVKKMGKAYLRIDKGDFNNDFNEDYDIETKYESKDFNNDFLK